MTEPGPPRLLLLGARGQLGWELARTLASLGEVIPLDRGRLDLADLAAVRKAARDAAAAVVVNAAAYTQVDRAESEPLLALRVNGEAPAVLADEAARSGALLVHFSTDYVFDGTGTRPYSEADTPSPGTVYGSSKLAGDDAVLRSGAQAYVFRVGWVYGRRGSSFLDTISRQARERDQLRVVADQHGSPTWSRVVAETATLAIAQWMTARRAGQDPPARGLYHMASPDYTTWHGFASEIVEQMPPREGWTRPAVQPITTGEYPAAAARPAWSVLDSSRLREVFGLSLPPWREQLARCMESRP